MSEIAEHKHHRDGPEDCFGCRVKSIHLGFTYGRETFHGPTLREKQEKHIAEQKAAGVDVTPVGARWV